MRCPNCGTNNPPEEQLTYCKKCGTELRVVCPRCSADNPGHAEHCNECGLELHPDRGHERAAGIRVDPDTEFIPAALKQRPTLSSGVLAAGIGILLVVWIPIFITLKKRAQFTGCQSNLQKMALAMQAYAKDNGGYAPSAFNWEDGLLPYLKDRNTLICPSRPGKIGYAFNLNLNESSLSHLNNSGTLIAFFEADGGDSLSGSQGIWMKKLAHSRGNNLVFVDGTVRSSKQAPAAQFWGAKVVAPPPAPEPTPAPVADHGAAPKNPNVSEVNPLPPGATPAPQTPEVASTEPPMSSGNSEGSASSNSLSGSNPLSGSGSVNPPPPDGKIGNPPPPGQSTTIE